VADEIEIDFLPVGDGEHSGDAIAVRWLDSGVYKVMIYDGGTRDYGAALVDHVKVYFNTEYVDYVVNSHPDNDHAGGLLYVLENLKVGELWMHRPWSYSAQIRDYFHDGRITDESLAQRLKQKMGAAHALEVAAEKRGVPIREPFAGSSIGPFTVLSPTKERYIHELVPQFEKSPELKEATAVESVLDMAKKAVSYIADAWHMEYLPDSVTTSAENESSVVLFAQIGIKGYLLTGDAGVQALRAASDHAKSIGIDLPKQVTFVQIPHHGGRHNVSTETLNMLVGEPLTNQDAEHTRTAYVSASEKAPSHPKKVVTNAFFRRGFRIGQTKGTQISHRSSGMPVRKGWGPVTYLPFFDEVEQ
jgi:beta-lactamase superfamily II metal-dependent hydrolase